MHVHKFACIPVVLLAACLFLTGCAGVPRYDESADPVLILPENAEMYAAFLTAADRTTFDSVCDSVFEQKQAAQIKKVLSYTNSVYAAVDSASENITVVAEGNYPVSLLSMALTGKNGWSKDKKQITGTSKVITYYRHVSGLQVVFPSNKLCIASLKSVSESLDALYGGYEYTADSLKEVSYWLSQKCTDEIPCAVYSTQPETLVAAILGPRISFGIKCAGISLLPELSDNSEFMGATGTVELTLLDSRAQPAALFILKAVSLALSQERQILVSAPDKEHILLENVTISSDTMVKLVHSGIPEIGKNK